MELAPMPEVRDDERTRARGLALEAERGGVNPAGVTLEEKEFKSGATDATRRTQCGERERQLTIPHKEEEKDKVFNLTEWHGARSNARGAKEEKELKRHRHAVAGVASGSFPSYMVIRVISLSQLIPCSG
ncbi:MAG: hypothetical protein LUE10_09595 [Alistipes sp.]|nr:hypothetical protein [Alistipes sp.]